MICSLCADPIQKSDSYSVTEYGRAHTACQREVGRQTGRLVMGAAQTDGRCTLPGFVDPIYVYRRHIP